MTAFEVQELAPQPAAAIRAEVPMAEIPSVFDRAFPTVMAAVEAQGAVLAGPPFGYYPRMPDDTVEVVVGFPVSGLFTADGEVVPFELPGGRAIVAVHVGPYDALTSTYAELAGWASAEGLEIADHMWETYLSDPRLEPDPATWQTIVTWPLA